MRTESRGAKELYNQILIKRFLLYIIIGVVILLIAIIAVIKIILSKKKQKKAEVKETTSEKTEEKENETQAEKVTDSADKTASPETSQDNQDDKPKSAENPNKLKQKLLAITDKFAPVSEKLKPALSKSKEFISSVLSKLKKKPAAVVEPKEETAPQQSNDEEKVDEIERVIVEVDENGNEIVVGASGMVLEPGRSVAVDPSIIPYGTVLIIDGQEYVAADTGITGYRLDFYYASHEEALSHNNHWCEVYLK